MVLGEPDAVEPGLLGGDGVVDRAGQGLTLGQAGELPGEQEEPELHRSRCRPERRSARLSSPAEPETG